MNESYATLKRRYASALKVLSAEMHAVSERAVATVLCIPRHGHAVTRVCLETLYEQTDENVVVVYVDLVSPPSVRRFLEEFAIKQPGFLHLKIDEYISRQTARLLVLDFIATPFTVVLDNNMLVGPGWLTRLMRCADSEGADVVSPFIVMQGGNVHFSGASLKRRTDGRVSRSQATAACPMAVPISSVTPEKLEIDFAESHCCLLRTSAFIDRIPEVFLQDMHNSFSLAVPTHILKTSFGSRMLIDPETVVSILPIAFGYDVPWLFASYNDLGCFQASYELNESIVGTAGSTTLGNLLWHRKHLIYLFFSMTFGENLQRTDLLRVLEAPDYVDGYDKPMPKDVLRRIENEVLPYIEKNYPEYVPHARSWLYDVTSIIAGIDRKKREFVGELPLRDSPTRGLLWRRFASENRGLY